MYNKLMQKIPSIFYCFKPQYISSQYNVCVCVCVCVCVVGRGGDVTSHTHIINKQQIMSLLKLKT